MRGILPPLLILVGATSTLYAAPPEVRMDISVIKNTPAETTLLGGTGPDPLPVAKGGAFYQAIHLPDEGVDLTYKLGFRPGPVTVPRWRKHPMRTVHLDLWVSRSAAEPLDKESPPDASDDLDLAGCWVHTLLELKTAGESILLRACPVLWEGIDVQPFDGSKFTLDVSGGPLLLFDGSPDGSDKVIFRSVNVENSSGIELGVPGIGQIILSHLPIEGGHPVGTIWPHLMEFSLGKRSFRLWSTTEILPAAQSRRKQGWTLFGKLSPLTREIEGAYYGAMREKEARD